MSFQKSVASLIRKYGSDVNIVRGENRVKTKAFIQPLRYRSNVYSDKNIELLGFSDGRYYLYIGEPSHVFLRKDNAIIISNGKEYVVHTSEIFEFCDKALYVWAVLKPKKDMRSDDFETD